MFILSERRRGLGERTSGRGPGLGTVSTRGPGEGSGPEELSRGRKPGKALTMPEDALGDPTLSLV